MKNFILIVFGQIISLFGNAALRFALPLVLGCNEKLGFCKKKRKRDKLSPQFRKYFYYIFYPVHVYALWFIGAVIMK